MQQSCSFTHPDLKGRVLRKKPGQSLPCQNPGVANQDDRVPVEVEEYLISVIAQAGGSAGGQGAATAARRMKTVVVERTIKIDLESDIAEAIRLAHPAAIALPVDDDLQRFAVPLGRTGLNRVVVDILDDGRTLRAYGKEGLLSRKPTKRVADEVERLLAG